MTNRTEQCLILDPQSPGIEEIYQTVPNNKVKTYKIVTPTETLFGKVYFDKPKTAQKEISNARLFEEFEFVSKLHFDTQLSNTSWLLAYEYIDGIDLQKYFSSLKDISGELDLSLSIRIIDQIYNLSRQQNVPNSSFSDSTPLCSPIREGFLSDKDHLAFIDCYKFVLDKNSSTVKSFPGIYSDRNPRNIIINSDKVTHVDFGRLENTSMIFDLIKFIRNGTDIQISSTDEFSTEVILSNDNYKRYSSFSAETEATLLRHTYDLFNRSEISFRDFQIMYQFGCIHNHFFYLSKYGKLISENRGDLRKIMPRFVYHSGALKDLFVYLTHYDDRVIDLNAWLSKMVDSVVTQHKQNNNSSRYTFSN